MNELPSAAAGQYGSVMFALGGRQQLMRVVLFLAAVDWVLAASLTVAGVNRSVAVPLLVAAAGTVLLSHASRVMYVVRAVRLARRNGGSGWTAAERALGESWSPRVARLALHEPRLLWSILLLVRGRRDGAPGPVFAAHGDALPVWLLLAAAAVVEVAVTPLLPLPPTVGAVLLVLGVWSVFVIAGLVAALVVHPHVVRPEVVVLRFGFWQEVVLPRQAIRRAVVTRTCPGPRGLTVANGQLVLSASGPTNIALEVDPALQVQGQPVLRVRVWADDPTAFVFVCRPQLAP